VISQPCTLSAEDELCTKKDDIIAPVTLLTVGSAPEQSAKATATQLLPAIAD
jgi:hypothetical protein